MMTSDIASAYPSGEHLIGNFVTDYTSNYEYYDRFIAKLFGERGIEVDKDATIEDVADEWTYDVNAVVFTHLNDWAKMYSASIKDYEPLWNVDGTVINTYGETHREDNIAQRQTTDVMGAKHSEDKAGARHSDEINPQHVDTNRTYNTAYPDGDSKEVEKNEDTYGAYTTQRDERTYTDEHDENTYTDTHTQTGYKDEFDADEHTDTERRTGNIGVTKSTELIESEFKLRIEWAFYKIIFSYILNEMGVHYYD